MANGSFLAGLQGLAGWLGNLILPVIAAYCVVLALVAFGKRRDGGHYMVAAFACLLGPGLASLAEAFVTSTPANAHDVYYNALLNLINWVGNVVMPTVASVYVVRGVLAIGGVMERLNIGDDWMRYFGVAFGCLMVSGIMRLLEHFVITANALHVGMLVHQFIGGGISWA
jgi:hypothetical protein